MLASRSKRIPSWKIFLAAIDGLVVFSALLTAGAIYCRHIGIDLSYFWDRNKLAFYLTWVTFVIAFYLSGLYEGSRIARFRSTVLAAGVGVGVGTLASVIVFYLLMSQKLGRLILLPVAAGMWVLLVAVRWLLMRMTSRGVFSQRAVVVGTGEEAAEAIRLTCETVQPGLKVYGLIAEHSSMVGQTVQGVPVVGGLDDLPLVVDTYNINTIIVATKPQMEASVLARLRPLRYRGIGLMDLMAVHEQLAQEIPLEYVNDEWLMAASMNNSQLHIAKLKRLMDVVVASVGLALAAPLCAVVAVLIKLDSRGPVLYRQERLGRGSEPFTLLKFRTMRADAEAVSGPVWAEDDDPRITRLGRWLRKLRIDEIPQLVNVLRGEMSLVGPRPERPSFVAELTEKIPFYGERLLVQPGITGWAQVNFPYTSSVEETRRKLQYDLYYIKHMSFSLDCLVLLRTIKIMLFARERARKKSAPAAEAGSKTGRAARDLASAPARVTPRSAATSPVDRRQL